MKIVNNNLSEVIKILNNSVVTLIYKTNNQILRIHFRIYLYNQYSRIFTKVMKNK